MFKKFINLGGDLMNAKNSKTTKDESSTSLLAQNEVEEMVFGFECAASAIPHHRKIKVNPDKKKVLNQAHGAGEDSFHVSNQHMIVADGVGGYNAESALYSRKLVHNLAVTLFEVYDELKDTLDIHLPSEAGQCSQTSNYAMKSLLGKHVNNSHKKVHKGKMVEGGSTLCFGSIIGDKLVTYNLGDSGFRIIRKNKIIHVSKEGLHGWNCPFQFGYRERRGFTDIDATHGDVTVHCVEENDVVIMGSDGLFDNLFDHEILEIVAREGEKHSETDDSNFSIKLSKAITEVAWEVSNKREKYTPFQMRSQRANRRWRGGKHDDITVVVGVVKTT